MNSMLCSRCKKRMAVVFVSRMEGDKTVNEGLCLQCAKELGIKPVEDLMNKMGISGDELDAINEQMMESLDGDGENGFELGGAQAFPFLNNIFGAPMAEGSEPSEEMPPKPRKKSAQKGQPQEKKYLNAYCENLTEKAAKGGFDPIIGREKEIGRVIQILNRRTKNNPCLVGQPGVGKTAIVEGLAKRIAEPVSPTLMLLTID